MWLFAVLMADAILKDADTPWSRMVGHVAYADGDGASPIPPFPAQQAWVG